MKINKCSDIIFAGHMAQAEMLFDEMNKILRWNMVVDLKQFGGKDIEFVQEKYPIVDNPYSSVDWNNMKQIISEETEQSNIKNYENLLLRRIQILSLKKIDKDSNDNCYYYCICENNMYPPKIDSISVDNYLGNITIKADRVNKINWFLDDKLCKSIYNVSGKMKNEFSIKNIDGKKLYFQLIVKVVLHFLKIFI